jgi:hypothetical protein
VRLEGNSQAATLKSQAWRGPVVQRRRLLAYNQETMVRVHPGSMHFEYGISDFGFWLRFSPAVAEFARIPMTIGACRNSGEFRYELCFRSEITSRLGRQSADHPRLERRMLWVQLPPEPFKQSVLAEQPGVLATLSRWRSRVQIPSGTP